MILAPAVTSPAAVGATATVPPVNALPVVCALLAVPASWAAGLLIDRVPDRLALWPPPSLRVTGQYLWCDLAMLGSFIALGYRFESAPVLLVVGYLLLAGALVTVSVIDIACFRLPDRIVLPALGLLMAIVVAESLRARATPSASCSPWPGRACTSASCWWCTSSRPRAWGSAT